MYFYVICTLFDITSTGILFFNSNLNNLFQRNQQRNWQVIQQLIQLRAQPILITEPQCLTLNLKDYHFGSQYTGEQKVWYTIFAVEYDLLYQRKNDSVAALAEDFDCVPMIPSLGESVKFEIPSLLTTGDWKNICFYSEQTCPSVLNINFDEIKNSLIGK